jgi:hypothetical protein
MPTRRPATWWHAHADDLRRLSTPEFAKLHDVKAHTISSWRKRLQIPSPRGRGHPRGPADGGRRWVGIDWGQYDCDIARVIGVSAETVRLERKRLELPPSQGRSRPRPEKPKEPKPAPPPSYWQLHHHDLLTLSVSEIMAKHGRKAGAVYAARRRAGVVEFSWPPKRK